MAKKGSAAKPVVKPAPPVAGRPSALLDTRVVYCRDNLEQLAKLPDAWLRRAESSRVDLIYIDPAPVSEAELAPVSEAELAPVSEAELAPVSEAELAPVSEAELPFNSNRNYEVFWGETKEKRSFEDRHAPRRPTSNTCVPAACSLPASSRKPAASTITVTGTLS